MSSSRHYYKSSSNALPPIREVLGEQLKLPPPENNPYSFDTVYRALPDESGSRSRSTRGESGPTLPPIHNYPQQGHSSSSSRDYSHHHSHSHSQHPSSHSHSHSQHLPSSSSSHPHPRPPSSHSHSSALGHSFDVLRPTATGFVNTGSSNRSHGILRTTRSDAGRPKDSGGDEDDILDSNKRYICDHCGKRFGRPSSLKTHEVVHSDEKPFKCSHPGCDKTFSVASNMRRHLKTHGPNARSDDLEYPNASSRGAGPSGRWDGGGGGYGDDYMPPARASGSSSGSGSGSHDYFSSSRRH